MLHSPSWRLILPISFFFNCTFHETVTRERIVEVDTDTRVDSDAPEVIYVPVPDVDGRVIASLLPPPDFSPTPLPGIETAIGTLEFQLTGTRAQTVSRVEIGWLEHPDMMSIGIASNRATDLFGDLETNPCRMQTLDGFVIAAGVFKENFLAFEDLAIEIVDETSVMKVNIVCPIVDNRISELIMFAPVLTTVEVDGEGSVTMGQTNSNQGWTSFSFIRPWEDPNCPVWWWGGASHLYPGQYSTYSYPLYGTPGDGISHTSPGSMEANLFGVNAMGCGQGHTLYGFRIHPLRWTTGGDIYLARDDVRFSTWKLIDQHGIARQTVRYPGGNGPFDMLMINPERVDTHELAVFRIEIDFCDEAVYGVEFCATKTPVSAYTSPLGVPPPWVMEACPYWVDHVTNIGPDTSSSGPMRTWPGPDGRCVRVEMSMD